MSQPSTDTTRLMVAIGPSPHSEELIRVAAAMAASTGAAWTAVYVQTPQPLSAGEAERLKRHVELARKMGAEVVTTVDEDLVPALLRTAREQGAGRIVVGDAPGSGLLGLLSGRSLARRLAADHGEFDIHVVRSNSPDSLAARLLRASFPALRSPLWHYGLACGVVGIVAALCYVALSLIDYHAVGMFLLAAVALLGLGVGRGPVLLAATLSALIWYYVFVPPRFAFAAAQFPDALIALLYFVVALVCGALIARASGKEAVARRREHQSTALYALVRDLSTQQSPQAIAAAALRHIETAFGADTAAACGPLLENANQSANPGAPQRSHSHLSADHEALLQMFLYQAAAAVERERLRGEAGRTRLLAESERFSKTLLNSISHELRTPLATITGAASSLMDAPTARSDEARAMLAADIVEAATRLNRLVANLLDMTRLESGVLSPKTQWCDVRDVINAVLANLREETRRHLLHSEVAAGFPLIDVDSGLLEQALANIVLNAVQYTPPGKAINVRAYVGDGRPTVCVEDNGPGVPAQSLPHLFEKFYRVPGARSSGCGLGLSIAKGFVEAHGGSVTMANRGEGGACVVVSLPPSRAMQPEGSDA
jgi:two-component system sensor histidine kinase KdpD